MNGKLILAGHRLEALNLRDRIDVAHALVTEGMNPAERQEFEQRMPSLWQEFALRSGLYDQVAETWGSTPEALEGQQQLMALLEQGPA